MSDRELRLRLLVRRHGVPEVKLVWNVPTGPDWTIAKLIAHVDEAIPLESGEWGLEDYAVELRGTDGEPFECLHFQQISKVLKDDDQVIIRSLLTDDIKRRRLSGRHQVSLDGKHLVDGLAFGRPWLRTPRDRPLVELPPRKRTRLTWDSDDDTAAASVSLGADEDMDRSPLLLEYDGDKPSNLRYVKGHPKHNEVRHERKKDHHKNVRFYADQDAGLEQDAGHEQDAGLEQDADLDQDAEEDEFEENDFQSDSDSSENESLMDGDEESLLDELRDIQEDHAAVEGDHLDDEVQLPPHPVQHISESPLPPPHSTIQAWIASLRISFPEKSVEEISQALSDSHYDTWEAYRRLDRQLYLQEDDPNPIRPSNPGPDSVSSSSSASSSSDSSSDSDSDSDLDSKNKPQKIHVPDVDDDSEDDSDFDADGASDDGSSSESSSDFSSDSSSSESEDFDEGAPTKTVALHKAEAVPRTGNGDISEDDDTVIRYPITSAQAVEHNEDSSSSDSSSSSDDSSSESEPEEMTSKPPMSQPKQQRVLPAPKPLSSAIESSQPPVPPGRGMRKTQRRNLRRRLAKQTTSQDQSELSIDEPSAASTPDFTKSQEEAEFLARKKALLEKMEVNTTVPSPKQPKTKTKSSKSAPENPSGITSSSTPENDTTKRASESSEQMDINSSAASRRVKLNVDAGRRMLFGALGLRNPKTKADEEKLRSKLMKDVRPNANPRTTDAESNQGIDAIQATKDIEEEDPDAWRQKINCRAVECCDEGIELSEPPFPFVQRWDPQQQFDQWKNKGKRKRPRRNASQYYEGEDSQAWKRQRHADGDENYDVSYVTEGDYTHDDIVLQYDDAPEEEVAMAQQVAAESQHSEVEDLPPLPEDLSTLKDLLPGEAKPYMVITWKRWLLSAQTSWQPQLVSVAAVVVKAEGDDGTGLRLLLAMRDRGLDKPEKTYDEGTGKRIYDKFEAPDVDEDEDEEEDETDNGYRDVQFSELIEPKILLAAGTQKQVTWTDRVVGETQNEEGKTQSECHNNGYEDQAMAEQPREADGEQDTLDLGRSAAVVDDAVDVSQHDLEEAGAGHQSRPHSTRSSPSPFRQLEHTSGRTSGRASAPEAILCGSEMYLDTDTFPVSEDNSMGNGEGDQPGQDGELRSEELPLDAMSQDMSSVPSGRQPDPEFSMDHANRSPVPSTGADDGPSSSELTPNAKGALKTPRKQVAPEPPSSVLSLPSVSEIWATATSRNSQSTQSPSRAIAESVLKKKILKDEEYEEAMRRIDDDEDEEEGELPDTPKKRLFPHATQPAEAPNSSLRIPPGSQVITISSDQETEEHVEQSAGESGDRVNVKETVFKGSLKLKKNQGQQKKGGKSRAVSMPARSAKLRQTGRTTASMAPQVQSATKNGKGRRSASTMQDM
ncbi:hypothetical protein ACHAQH_003837 [Verticillium albo-atrum]